MSLHFADIWEAVADAIPDAEAIIYNERRLNWADYDKRAARVAAVLAGHGLEPGAKLSIYSYNHPAWLETQFAAFKAGLTPININYRYLDDELVHVITNSDSEAVVFQAQFAPRVAAIRERLPEVKLFLEVADGSGEHLPGALDYEAALAAADPQPRRARSGEDIYMLYTGGTTGLPKGVMYTQRDFAETLSAVGFALRGIETPADTAGFAAFARGLHEAGEAPRSISACPLMHGTGMWVGSILPMTMGGVALLFDNTHFDADVLWKLAEVQRASEVTLVGDVFAKPMLVALDAARAGGRPYALDSLKMMTSSGVMWSHEVKKGLLDHCDITIIDVIGSTEGGMGSSIVTRATIDADQTARFVMNPTTKVFDDEDNEVQARIGRCRAHRQWRHGPDGLLQGREEIGGDFSRNQRSSLRDSRRFCHRRGRRQHLAARPRFGLHQLGRRENLPRRGRGGDQDPHRGLRLPCRRCARRALWRTGDRARFLHAPKHHRSGRARRPRARTDRRLQGAAQLLPRRYRPAGGQWQARLQDG